ncbi:MAG: RNA-guided endonuclease InsQ/TnpB family protein [Candidatus Hodarchaeales archaeon]
MNNKEQTLLAKCAGTARFAWNWGLAARIIQYKENQGKGRYTDAMKQHVQLNKLKKTDYSWMYDVSKCIPQEALRDLQRAFENFFRDLEKSKQTRSKRRVGFPKFKKKGRCKDSFRLTGTIRVYPGDKLVQLPRLGKLRLKEKPALHPTARILSATVSRSADSWFVALTVEEKRPDPSPAREGVVGFDAGLKRFGYLSSGIPIPKPRFLLKRTRKLRRLSKDHSRKQPGSNNRKKSAKKLAKFHRKVRDTRHDFLHKQSTYLTKNHGMIVIEDLHVKGLIKNKKQSKYWADLAHGEFQRMLEYKAPKHGARIIEADRWFPSSKLCSNCLWYNAGLTLQDRVFCCPQCELELDRDENASRNLENYYYMYNPLLELERLEQEREPVAASSAETLNALPRTGKTCELQARLDEAGS